MSSNEESDDEFQSADEDIDFETHSEKGSQIKTEDLDDSKNNEKKTIDQLVPDLDHKLKLLSNKKEEIKSIVSTEETEKASKSSEPTIETPKQQQLERDSSDSLQDSDAIKSEDNKLRDDIFGQKLIKNKTKEEKPIIKGRKIMRKNDRFREQTNTEEDFKTTEKPEIFEEKMIIKEDMSETKPIVLTEEKEMSNTSSEPLIETPELKSQNKSVFPKIEDNKTDNRTEIRTEELIPSETDFEKIEENKTKEDKTVIKGRILLRKADRLKEQTNIEESEISEEKKMEVLNKLSAFSEREDTSSKWNNWFSDIKSAAITATSTTASHVSQASNKWSLNPKSLLTSAASITSNVGSGISSVVENVSSVVDSAIGAPPPEQMAALFNKDTRDDNTPESDGKEKNEIQNKSSLGFGLFDYTLNTLESIGKKTLEVIVDDKQKRDKPQD